MEPLITAIGAVLLSGWCTGMGWEWAGLGPHAGNILWGAALLLGGGVSFLAGRYLVSLLPHGWRPRSCTILVLALYALILLLFPFSGKSDVLKVLREGAGLLTAFVLYAGMAVGTYGEAGRPRGFSLIQWLSLRLFLLPQLPFLILSVLLTAINLSPSLQVFLLNHRWVELVIWLGLSASVVLAAPFGIRLLFPSRKLEGALSDRFNVLAARAGVGFRNVILWHTGPRSITNACVAGLFAPVRYVFITDALLKGLEPDEAEAVFAHEVSHVRNHHIFVLIFFFLGMVGSYTGLYLLGGEALGWWGYAASVLWWGGFLLGPFAWVSRALELEADFGVVNLGADPGAFIRALKKLEVLSGKKHKGHSWRHFSIPYRIRAVEDYVESPSARGKFHLLRKRTRSAVLATGAAGALLFFGAQAVESPPEVEYAFQGIKPLIEKGRVEEAESQLVSRLKELQFERTGVSFYELMALKEKEDFLEELKDNEDFLREIKRERLRAAGFELLEEIYKKQGEKQFARRAARKARSIESVLRRFVRKEQEDKEKRAGRGQEKAGLGEDGAEVESSP